MMTAEPAHNTPFEHAVMSWEIATPIFVARQLMRHRIGTFDEQSMRATAGTGEFYEPTIDRIDPEGENSTDINRENIKDYRHTMREAQTRYEMLVNDGCPREVARGVLGTATMTRLLWTVNCWSFLNWLEKRTHNSAQEEHRELATMAWLLWQTYMPMTAAAFYKKLRHGERRSSYESLALCDRPLDNE